MDVNERRPVVLLDPTNERTPAARPCAPRLRSLEHARIALLDISKPRGNVFLDRIETRLRDRGAEVIRFCKPTFTKPAPNDLRHDIAEQCGAIIEALAD